MRTRLLPLAVMMLVFAGVRSPAMTTHYVDLNCTNPVSPYTNWMTAATNIQSAVDVSALSGDVVLVTNGIYQTGTRSISGVNRVAVDSKTVRIQSVNGPSVTIIKGAWDAATNGAAAVRCVYLSGSSMLSGFTLTNGATQTSGIPNVYGGGIFCASANCVVTNCVITGNAAYGNGGGGYSGAFVNCALTGNTAGSAGGIYLAALNNCVLSGNRASSGGGSGGGGALSSALTNCLVSGNSSAYPGGGDSGGTLVNCLVTSNSAPTASGVASATANNCLFNGNTNGSAAYSSTLNNCTLAGNFSSGLGTANGCTFNNSIIYYNSNNGNYADCYQCKLTNSCTPLGNGTPSLSNNSISNAPAFVDLANDNFRLQVFSPCINSGTNIPAVAGVDLDGNPRIVGGAVDMGCYENQNTNPVHFVNLSNSVPMSPYTNWLTAATNIQDAVDASTNGDLVLVTNGLYVYGGKDVFGSNRVAVTMAITVQSVNGSGATIIKGLTNGVNVRCVFLTNGATLIGFTLTNGASSGSAGGVFSSGFNSSTISNCVIVGNSAPSGGGAFNGVFYNCTIKGNYGNNGGGVSGATLYNCLVSSNTAGNGGGSYSGTAYDCQFIGNTAGNGGGGYNSFFQNCLLTGNLATGSFGGGGAYQSSLENCTVVANRCFSSGGIVGGALNCGSCISCILYNNTSLSHASTPNYSGGGFLYNCCTTPLPPGNNGNFTSDPLLVNQAGGDFHLQPTSPCINAGNNIYASSGSTDLDGNARIVVGTVDVGAYEYQTPASVLSYAWEQQYGLSTDGTADNTDADGDGMSNFAEWKAGTNPTDASSVLKVASPTNSVSGIVVTWQSVSGVTYYLQRGSDLSAQPVFSTIQSNILGQAGTTSFTDTSATGNGPFFYRVGVQ